jgi:outer membrane protein assembly factor BamB
VASTGTLKWKYTLPVEDYHAAGPTSPPAVNNGIVYLVGTCNQVSSLFALDANTGALKWKYKFTTMCLGSPTIANNIIYIGVSNLIYALDATTGALKWTFTLPANKYMNGTMAFSNNVLYFGATDATFGGAVYALDTNTLTLKWKYGTSGWFYNPAVANNKVYCFGTDNMGPALVVLDASIGQLLWSNGDLGGDWWRSVTLSRGILYGGDWRLCAFDANTGVLKWSYGFPGKTFESSPEIGNGKIYFTTSDGYVYCFGQ